MDALQRLRLLAGVTSVALIACRSSAQAPAGTPASADGHATQNEDFKRTPARADAYVNIGWVRAVWRRLRPNRRPSRRSGG